MQLVDRYYHFIIMAWLGEEKRFVKSFESE